MSTVPDYGGGRYWYTDNNFLGCHFRPASSGDIISVAADEDFDADVDIPADECLFQIVESASVR